MKKVVFLGYVVSPEEANVASGASVAGNKMQWNLIKNLSQNEDINISCVTVAPRAVFPHDHKLYLKKEREELFPNVVSYRVSYCNLPIIKQLWQIFSVYRTAKKIVKQEVADIVFCFNLFPQIGVPMRWLKKKFKKIETVCLLADLPIDDNTQRKGISVWLRSFMERSTWKSMKKCDKYIVLNKHVIEKYLPEKPYIVVEGGVSEEDVEKYSNLVHRGNEKNILYCGALTEYNGILNLIQAMELLEDKNVYLDIYGSGYLEEEVKEAAVNNDKIRYFGRVSNKEVMKEQKEAWLLINPRIVSDSIAQVTFPSKTFEYMLSGTPVLSTKLNGYSDEYFEYLFVAEQDDAIGLSDAINDILSKSNKELTKKAEGARRFILEKKSWKKQVELIAGFIGAGYEKNN